MSSFKHWVFMAGGCALSGIGALACSGSSPSPTVNDAGGADSTTPFPDAGADTGTAHADSGADTGSSLGDGGVSDGNAPADSGTADGTLPADSGTTDGSSPSDSGSADGSPSDASGDAADARVACQVVSTCTSVSVVFEGWVTGDDGGVVPAQLAVDDGTPDGGVNGTVVPTAAASDAGGVNQLVGNFVTTADGGVVVPLEYATDNLACTLPNFASRMNRYVLAPMQGLPVASSWYDSECSCGGPCGGAGACDDAGTGGICDFESDNYSISCPNFGSSCIVTPRKIESIQIAAGSDPTCEVCFYSSTDPSPSTILKCVAAGNTVSGADLSAAGADASTLYPLLLRLDDGSNCASY